MLCSLAQHFGEDVTFIFRELHHPVERLSHKGVDKTVTSTYHMSFPLWPLLQRGGASLRR